MSVEVKGVDYDTMGEACARLEISRSSMLRYLDEGFFTPAYKTKQGRGKVVRYFPEDWYAINQPRILASRKNGASGKQAANSANSTPPIDLKAPPSNPELDKDGS